MDRHRGKVLCLVAGTLVVGSTGVVLRPWAALVVLTIVGFLVAVGLSRGLRWSSQLSWMGGLLLWAMVDAGIRQVSPYAAAAAVAVGAVAFVLVLVGQDPRVRSGAHPAVAVAGTVAATWLIAEKLIVGHRPGGPFANPNLGATVALLAFAATPWLRTTIVGRLGLGTILVGGIVASGSRAAMLGVVVVATFWALSRGGRRLRASVTLVAILAAVGLAARVAGDEDPLRFERLRIWKVALRTTLAELPFGAGPGGFVDAALPHNFPRTGEFGLYYRVPSSAESDALQLAATLGIPGLILSGGLVLVSLAALLQTGTLGCGVAMALLVTSSFHSQLSFPSVAWVATLAVVGCGRPLKGPTVRLSRPMAAALAVAMAVPVVAALGVWGGGPVDLAAPAAAAQKLTPSVLGSDAALSDVEAELWRESALRPRFAHAWRVLGSVRLRRAELRRDPALVAAAADAFSASREHNPLDVWAAVGLGQANRMLGRLDAAEESFLAATTIEPNCVPAWLELGRVHLEQGELRRASGALRRAESAIVRAQSVRFITRYERALAAADPSLLSTLRAVTGGR